MVIVLGYVYFRTKTSPKSSNLPVVVSADDKKLVEDYIKKYIATLAPERVTLGGKWTVTEISINTTSRSGTFKYEDGHISGVAEFRFTKNANGLSSFGTRKIQ
jgi:hypothetical protein